MDPARKERACEEPLSSPSGHAAGGYGDLFMTAGSKEELKFFIKGLRRALKEPILNEEDL